MVYGAGNTSATPVPVPSGRTIQNSADGAGGDGQHVEAGERYRQAPRIFAHQPVAASFE
jgi:hypothetical protein